MFSALFHSTLWWIGQKSDEIIENITLILLYRLFDSSTGMILLHVVLVAFGILWMTTLLICELHMISIIIACIFQFRYRSMSMNDNRLDVRRTIRLDVRHHVFRAAMFSVGGFVLWLIDRLMCEQVGQWPQLHAWWHVAVACSLHEVFVSGVALWAINQEANGDPVMVKMRLQVHSRRCGFATINASIENRSD